MQKLQADNGWQTKLVPDSRAIIKLGLGPAQDDIASLQSAVTAPIRSSYSSVTSPRNSNLLVSLQFFSISLFSADLS